MALRFLVNNQLTENASLLVSASEYALVTGWWRLVNRAVSF